jgi:amino acid permease
MLHLLREKDYTLMSRIHKFSESKQQQSTINNWRIFFQVSTLSQIVNFSGDKIQQSVFNRKYVDSFKQKSRLRWPIQKRPYLSTFIIWTNYIQHITSCTTNGKLPHNIGNWTEDPSTTIEISTWIHRDFSHILTATDHEFKVQLLLHDKYGKNYYNIQHNSCIVTVDCNQYIPVDIIQSTHQLIVKQQLISKIITHK